MLRRRARRHGAARTRDPQAVRTLLADFSSLDAAAHAVSAIIATGIVPAALEMMDAPTIQAVEASIYAAGYPTDAAAILLIELDGAAAGLDDDVDARRRASAATPARAACASRRIPPSARGSGRDARRRSARWAASAPHLVVQDAVVPRTKLPAGARRDRSASAARHDVHVCNVFHAGDGNLHPNIGYDASDPDESERVHAAMTEIMQACIDAGGTITGEHGVGLDKLPYMDALFSARLAGRDVRAARASSIPTVASNPGKVVPVHAAASGTCAPSARPRASVTSDAAASDAARQRGGGTRARRARPTSAPLRIVGRGHVARRGPSGARATRAARSRARCAGSDRVRARRPHAHRARRHDRSPRSTRLTAREGQWLALDPFGGARAGRSARRSRRRRPVRSHRRSARRAISVLGVRVRHGHGRGRARGRTRREERRRLRPHAAHDRRVGNARRHHRGHGAAARACPTSGSHAVAVERRAPPTHARWRQRAASSRRSPPSCSRRRWRARLGLGEGGRCCSGSAATRRSSARRASRCLRSASRETWTPQVWTRLSTSRADRHQRCSGSSTRPSRLAAVCGAASRRRWSAVARRGALRRRERGVVRCIVPLDAAGDEEFARLRGIIGTLRVDTSLVAERLPAALWAALLPRATARSSVAWHPRGVRSDQRPESRHPRRAHVSRSAFVVSAMPCVIPGTPLADARAGIDACVHCGFCLQACPTYLTLEDENDSPRGRIVLMRRIVEGTLAGRRSRRAHAHRPVPRLPRLRDRVSVRRAVRPAARGHARDAHRRDSRIRPIARADPVRVRAASAARDWRCSADGSRARSRLSCAAVAPAGPARLRHGDARVDAGAAATRRTYAPSGDGTRGTATLLTGCVMEGLFAETNRATERTLAVNDYAMVDGEGQRCCGALHAHAGDARRPRASSRARTSRRSRESAPTTSSRTPPAAAR